MANIVNLKRPIVELAAEVQSGKVSAVSLVEASLERLEETRDYHTYLELNEHALEQAAEIDKRIAVGETVGPLAGVPYLAKDNFLTTGTHTTAASHILEPFKAPYQAVAIERLEQAGAIMMGKANLDAFGHGASTENSDFGPSKNPVDPEYVPGGSSGGAAAAVALGQVSFALGTDTGGSLRQPSSYCGVVGYKPTYGLVPRYGVVAMGSSFDCVGPVTNSALDAATVLNVLAGRDDSDATSIEREEGGYEVSKITYRVAGKKIGLIKEHMGQGLDPAIKQGVEVAVAKLKAAGATVEEVSLPSVSLALAAYYILVSAEVSSNLARYDGVRYGHSSRKAHDLEGTYRLSREEGFGPEAKRRILIGTYVLSSGYYDAYYKRAQAVRTTIIDQFNEAFTQYDGLIGPTAPTPAFKLDRQNHDPLDMYLNDVMTVSANLVGIPSISIPLGTTGNLPFGLQIMAPQRQDSRLLGLADAVEKLL
jgi:aspartyl-tRNA(Asn)/glutamyl-tRNA(Gln) amidotransferase subunit A